MNSVQTNIYQTHLAEEPLLLHDASSMFQLVKNLPAMQKTPVQFLGWKDPLEKGKATQYSWASLAAQLVKNPPAMWETWLWSLGWEDPLEKGKATVSSILPGEFHGLYSPWGRKESDTTFTYHFSFRNRLWKTQWEMIIKQISMLLPTGPYLKVYYKPVQSSPVPPANL